MIYSSKFRDQALRIGVSTNSSGTEVGGRNFGIDLLSITGTAADSTDVIPSGCSGLMVQIESQGGNTEPIELRLVLDGSTNVILAIVGRSTIDQGSDDGRFWIPLNVGAVTSNYPKFQVKGSSGHAGTSTVRVVAYGITPTGNWA